MLRCSGRQNEDPQGPIRRARLSTHARRSACNPVAVAAGGPIDDQEEERGLRGLVVVSTCSMPVDQFSCGGGPPQAVFGWGGWGGGVGGGLMQLE